MNNFYPNQKLVVSTNNIRARRLAKLFQCFLLMLLLLLGFGLQEGMGQRISDVALKQTVWSELGPDNNSSSIPARDESFNRLWSKYISKSFGNSRPGDHDNIWAVTYKHAVALNQNNNGWINPYYIKQESARENIKQTLKKTWDNAWNPKLSRLQPTWWNTWLASWDAIADFAIPTARFCISKIVSPVDVNNFDPVDITIKLSAIADFASTSTISNSKILGLNYLPGSISGNNLTGLIDADGLIILRPFRGVEFSGKDDNLRGDAHTITYRASINSTDRDVFFITSESNFLPSGYYNWDNIEPATARIYIKPQIPASVSRTKTICGDEATNIGLSSTLNNTTYDWTVTSSADIIGSSAENNNSGLINQKLTNNGTVTGTVTYTVTPVVRDLLTLEGGTRDTRGDPVQFVVTVRPNPPPPEICEIVDSNISYTITPPTSQEGATYRYYDDESMLGFGPTYVVQTSAQGMKTLFYTRTGLEANACESPRAQIQLLIRPKKLILTFVVDEKIYRNDEALLKVEFEDSNYRAPKGGITVSLMAASASTAEENIDYELFNPTIYIPEYRRSAIITVQTKGYLEGEKTLIMEGVPPTSAEYVVASKATLIMLPNPKYKHILLNPERYAVVSGEKIRITARLINNIKASTTLTITLAHSEDDSRTSPAKLGEHYSNLSQTITIPVGANSVTVEVYKTIKVNKGTTYLYLSPQVVPPDYGFIPAPTLQRIAILPNPEDELSNTKKFSLSISPTVIRGRTLKVTARLLNGEKAPKGGLSLLLNFYNTDNYPVIDNWNKCLKDGEYEVHIPPGQDLGSLEFNPSSPSPGKLSFDKSISNFETHYDVTATSNDENYTIDKEVALTVMDDPTLKVISFGFEKETITAGETVKLIIRLPAHAWIPNRAAVGPIELVADASSSSAVSSTHYQVFDKNISFQGPVYSNASKDVLIKTIIGADYGVTKTLTIRAIVPEGYNVLSSTPTLNIYYPFKIPEITNTSFTKTICSGDLVNIALSSTLPNTTYEWITKPSGNVDVKKSSNLGKSIIEDQLVFQRGSLPQGGLGGALGQGLAGLAGLAGLGQGPATVTYTVTPMLENDHSIKGKAQVFTVTVLPRIEITPSIEVDSRDQSASFVMPTIQIPTPGQPNVHFQWYKDQTCTDIPTILPAFEREELASLVKPADNLDNTLSMLVRALGGVTTLVRQKYSIDIQKPGTYTYYGRVQVPGLLCVGPVKVNINAQHRIYLAFNPASVVSGTPVVLTASLSGTIKAPAEGITITINRLAVSTAKPGTHHTELPHSVYISGGQKAVSITLSTTAGPDFKGSVSLTVSGQATGGYTMASTPTLRIEYPITQKPEITNTELRQTICSGESFAITPTSSLIGTTYRWVSQKSEGLQRRKNIVILNDGTMTGVLTVTAEALGTLTYTVTPEIMVGGTKIKGESKDFVITVMPRLAKIADQTISVPTNFGKYRITIDPLRDKSRGRISYKWYEAPDSVIPIKITGEEEGYQVEVPITRTYYVATNKADFCDSERATITVFPEKHLDQKVHLAFSQVTVPGGDAVILTASVSNAVRVNEETKIETDEKEIIEVVKGIDIRLLAVRQSTAKEEVHYLPFSPTIFIPVGKLKGSITISTIQKESFQGYFDLSIAGQAPTGYVMANTPTLRIAYQTPLKDKGITLKFEQTAIKGGASARLTASLLNLEKATENLVIKLQRSGQSTADDQNYSSLIDQITIPSGENSATLDAFSAKTEATSSTLILIGTNLTSGYTISENNPTITILGKKPSVNPIITLEFNQKCVQGGEETMLKASLPEGIMAPKNIRIKLKKAINSTAKRNKNYKSYPEEIVIPANKNSVEINFFTLNEGLHGIAQVLYLYGQAKDYLVTTDYITIKSYTPEWITDFNIPNVFSPNGNDLHDVWNIVGIERYPKATVIISNRLGIKIFKSKDGYPDPWNGMIDGKPLPIGTYYYIIDLKNGNPLIAGYVVLIR